MFRMFGFGGVACPRCNHRNAGEAGYCEQCGLSLGAPRNEPVLRDNRWIPGERELAVFFGVRELDGLFVKTLRVPPTTRAYILQAGKATEVPQGEYDIETFFTRLNNLLRDQHAEILITRTAALPVEFSFDGLRTAEHLLVSATFSVSVKIEQIAAFAQHFMNLPGTVTVEHVRELLAPSVRQLAAEFLAGQSLRDLARNRDLRPQLDERLQSSLKQRFAQFGLAVVQVDTLAVRHDKFDANRDRIGSLWLVADERNVQLEHAKHIDQLYNDEEWQRIWREEQDSRLRLRRSELRQDETAEQRELALQQAERLQELRQREIELYARIVGSKHRKEALDKGAGDTLAALEHELAKKGAAREDESTEWAHLRAMAQARMQTELEAAQQDAQQARILAQQRFRQQLMQQQILIQVDQANLIEDEARKRTELTRLHAAQQEAKEQARALEAEQHKAALQTLVLANAARAREAEREQEWEEQQALARRRELLRAEALKNAGSEEAVEQVRQRTEALRRSGTQSEALAQHEKLLRTIEADAAQQRVALEVDEHKAELRRREQEAAWQHELNRLAAQRDEQAARWKAEHENLLVQQAHELARIETMGRVSDTAKLATAGAANVAALAEVMKTQVHAGMSAQQLAALAGVVGAAAGVTPQEAQRMADERVREQRAAREQEVDKDRQHQLGLLKHQNEVNQAALAAQAALGVGVAQGGRAAPRVCTNGHAVGPGDKFCAQCGAALSA